MQPIPKPFAAYHNRRSKAIVGHRLVSPFRHLNFTIRNLTRAAPWIMAPHQHRQAAKAGLMKYKIKSFILGVKEARRRLCTSVHGQPARRAYDMGRKLSNGFMDLLKLRIG
jgi:hypothetical protein